MNSTLDKLLPGWLAKLTLFTDLLLLGITLVWASRVPASQLVSLGVWALIAWLVAISVLRLYSPSTPRTFFDEVVLRLVAVFGVTVVLDILDPLALRALRFAIAFAASGAAMRAILWATLGRLERPLADVLIVGTRTEALRVWRALQTERRAQVRGFLTFEGEPVHADIPGDMHLGSASELLQVLHAMPVHEVYVAGNAPANVDEMQSVVALCERVGIPFALPACLLQLERAAPVSAQGHVGYLHFCATPYKPVQYALKRLLDITASFLALVVLSPLLLLVALLVKLSSPGPVFFVQPRVGLHGATFGLLKFRSMVVNAEALQRTLWKQNEQSGPVFKMQNDPRITPIGRFIRKYSIDELPQLINVLRGDMTLVGPRPALAREVEQYEVWQRRRLSVRPGLTCYWQVSGRNEIGFDEWMRLDLRYVDHWNLAVDVRLILKTLPVVLAGRGAS